MQWSISMRPHTFNEMYGCDNLKKYFYNLKKQNKPYPSAVLFEGIFGGGKTTSAKILAQMISCESPKENGDPCCECPSCRAIIDETFSRDCIQIDGGQTGKDEIVDTLQNFVSKPAYRGNHQKVVIMEEVQELSGKAKNALLKILEKPREDLHFIFTSMEPLSVGGVKSRCVAFPFKSAGMKDLMYYMKGLLEKTETWSDPNILRGKEPVSVWGPVLQTIATNASGSYRQATQLLEQCILCEAFTPDQIKESTNMIDINTWYDVLHEILEGNASDAVMNNMIEGDYQNNFNLAYKVISDAETFKVFGKLSPQNAYFEQQAASLARHPNFNILLQAYKDVSARGGKYAPKADYLIRICEAIEACKQAKSANPSLEGVTMRPVRKVLR